MFKNKNNDNIFNFDRLLIFNFIYLIFVICLLSNSINQSRMVASQMNQEFLFKAGNFASHDLI